MTRRKSAQSNQKTDSPTRLKVALLKERFRRAHREGMAALASGDYAALGKAIELEHEIIDEQKAMIEAQGMGRLGGGKRGK